MVGFFLLRWGRIFPSEVPGIQDLKIFNSLIALNLFYIHCVKISAKEFVLITLILPYLYGSAGQRGMKYRERERENNVFVFRVFLGREMAVTKYHESYMRRKYSIVVRARHCPNAVSGSQKHTEISFSVARVNFKRAYVSCDEISIIAPYMAIQSVFL